MLSVTPSPLLMKFQDLDPASDKGTVLCFQVKVASCLKGNLPDTEFPLAVKNINKISIS